MDTVSFGISIILIQKGKNSDNTSRKKSPTGEEEGKEVMQDRNEFIVL